MPETTTPFKPRHQSGFLAGAFAKLKQNLKRRLLRRSAVHQLRNARISLSRLIKTSQTFDATLNVGQEPTRDQYDELAKRKGSFCLDAVGPVTLEQIKRFLIDPVLPPADVDGLVGQAQVGESGERAGGVAGACQRRSNHCQRQSLSARNHDAMP